MAGIRKVMRLEEDALANRAAPTAPMSVEPARVMPSMEVLAVSMSGRGTGHDGKSQHKQKDEGASHGRNRTTEQRASAVPNATVPRLTLLQR